MRSLETFRRQVRSPGVSKVSPRPFHPKAEEQKQEAFRNNVSAVALSSPPEGADPACVDSVDEARIGQKHMLTRGCASRGGRPRVVREYRYGSCELFNAICSASGVATGHICNGRIPTK